MEQFHEVYSRVFKEKFGQTAYKIIYKNIIKESKHLCTNQYIEIIFLIATLEWAGATIDQIKGIIKHTLKVKINVKELIKKHNISISKIKNYLYKGI